MRPAHAAATLALISAGLACGGGGDGGGGGAPVDLSGTVLDYWTGLPVGAVAVAGGGQVGNTVADANGNFVLSVPPNSGVQLTASKNGHHNTRNESIPVAAAPVTADIYIASLADVARQYTAVGLMQAVDSVFVIIELDDAGTPREGLPLANIRLVDQFDDAVGAGPFVFGQGGDIVPTSTLSVTTAFGGRSRVAFLNVPARRLTLQVDIPPPNAATLLLAVSGSTNGVVLGRR